MTKTVPALAVPSNGIAYQHNHLIRQPLKLTPLEVKIFLLALRCVRHDDTELPSITIPLTDIMPKINGGKDYEQITQACRSLLTKRIQLIPVTVTTPKKNAKWHEANILQDIGIDPSGTGTVTGTFSVKVKPYLVELKGNYTMGEIAKLLAMTNPNTYRLYWLVKSWDGVGHHRFQLDELRNLLFEEDDQYPTFYDFKRYVLDSALAAFHEMDWKVSYEPVKTGKKVTAVDFVIPKLDVKQRLKDSIPAIQLSLAMDVPAPKAAPNLPEKFTKLYGALKTVWLLEPYQVNLVAEAVGTSEVKLEKVRGVMSKLNAEKSGLNNLAAALWAALPKELPSLKKLYEARYPKQAA
jgi:hypothetical protein